jgi:hypothetical protein
VDEVELVLEVVERSWPGASHWSPFQAVALILLMKCVRRLRHCLGRGRAGPGWWWGVRRWRRAGRGWSRCRLWPSGTSPPSGGRRRVPPATAQRPRRHTRRDGRPGRRRLAREPRVRRRRRLQHQPRPALPGLSGTPRPGPAGRPAVDPGPGLPPRSRHSASIWIRWKSSRIRCANAICSSLAALRRRSSGRRRWRLLSRGWGLPADSRDHVTGPARQRDAVGERPARATPGSIQSLSHRPQRDAPPHGLMTIRVRRAQWEA